MRFEQILRICDAELRLAKEGFLEPRDAFQSKRSNTYFQGKKGFFSGGGVADDHIPFVKRSENICLKPQRISELYLHSVSLCKIWLKQESKKVIKNIFLQCYLNPFIRSLVIGIVTADRTDNA